MPERAQSFEDQYRTRDDQLLFLFRFRCDAGSSTWRFAVKYGDVKMTLTPASFHDPGLVLYGETREDLLHEAARWAECIQAFYNEVPVRKQDQQLQTPEMSDVGR
jgi:hypothetical protein